MQMVFKGGRKNTIKIQINITLLRNITDRRRPVGYFQSMVESK